MMKFEWETILSEGDVTWASRTVRARVYGGWIVMTTSTLNYQLSQSSIFVPDPKHKWEVDVV